MNSVPKEITVEMLRDWNACREGVAAFRRVFGQSAAFPVECEVEAERLALLNL